jgi:segregation and condensation protein A
LRTPKILPQRLLAPEVDPLPMRIARVVALLRDRSGPVPFTDFLTNATAPELVSAFLAVVHLWHQQVVEIHQSAAYQDIWVQAEKAEHGDS